MERTLIAAMMSQRFVFDLVPGHPVEPEATLTLRPRRGMRMVARRAPGAGGPPGGDAHATRRTAAGAAGPFESPLRPEVPMPARRSIEHRRVVVIGAGIAGIGLGVRLLRQGIDDFAIFERNASVGGTWFEHTYPGCGCDIPTHLYSYSFARNPRWSRLFPQQHEILAYVRGVADDHGVMPHIRFEHEMERCEWDEDAGCWRVRTSGGELTCDVLVSAIGATAEPAEPEIPGSTSSAAPLPLGPLGPDHDLAGERVAVIGTGPAAAQFVPRIQPHAGRLVVFQRTPPWVLPHARRSSPAPSGCCTGCLPGSAGRAAQRLFALYEATGIGFRGRTELIAPMRRSAARICAGRCATRSCASELTPRYRFGCKRPICPTRGTRRSRPRQCEVVTDRSRASSAVRSSRATARATRSTRSSARSATATTARCWPSASSASTGARSARSGTSSPRAYLGIGGAGLPELVHPARAELDRDQLRDLLARGADRVRDGRAAHAWSAAACAHRGCARRRSQASSTRSTAAARAASGPTAAARPTTSTTRPELRALPRLRRRVPASHPRFDPGAYELAASRGAAPAGEASCLGGLCHPCPGTPARRRPVPQLDSARTRAA